MDSKEYQRRVLETESKPEEIKFGTLATYATLKLISDTAEIVDMAKKAMFYGRGINYDAFIERCGSLVGNASQLASQAETGSLTEPDDLRRYGPGHFAAEIEGLDLSFLNKRLLHAVIGCNSETGEQADALLAAWVAQAPVDRVNFAEEVGDGLWYQAVAADELGIPFNVLFEQNITKLQDKKNGRYKQGSFDVDGANNRNLADERVLLEQGVVATPEELNPVPAALTILRTAIQNDLDYAEGWHSNLAQAFIAEGAEYNAGQRAAGRFMEALFDVSVADRFIKVEPETSKPEK